MRKRYSFEQVKKDFESRGYILLETQYKNNKTPMRFSCPNHPYKKLRITYKNLKKGQGCRYCGIEKMRRSRTTPYEVVKSDFEKRGYILLENEYRGNYFEKLRYICQKHKDVVQSISLSNLRNGHGCYYCGLEKNMGSGNQNWKGGVSSLNVILRQYVEKWKWEWLEKFDKRCAITGKKSHRIEIHHPKPFHKIRDEVLTKLGLRRGKQLRDYTDDELKMIVDELRKRHDEIVGIPMNKKLHKLFHKIYGNDTTLEDVYEFKARYLAGEFDGRTQNQPQQLSLIV